MRMYAQKQDEWDLTVHACAIKNPESSTNQGIATSWRYSTSFTLDKKI